MTLKIGSSFPHATLVRLGFPTDFIEYLRDLGTQAKSTTTTVIASATAEAAQLVPVPTQAVQDDTLRAVASTGPMIDYTLEAIGE